MRLDGTRAIFPRFALAVPNCGPLDPARRSAPRSGRRHTSPASRAAGAFALVSAAAGCAAGAGPPDEPTTPFELPDSAGIAIIENHVPAWEPGQEWSLGPEPVLTIGGQDGGAGGGRFGRIVAARRLADGRILVTDAAAGAVRLFDPDGRFLYTVGRPGDGPGEIQRVGGVAVLAGDSIVIRDSGASKHEIFAPDGSHVRTVAEPLPPSWNGLLVYVADWWPDGSLLVTHSVPVLEMPRGLSVIHEQWHRFDAEGNHLQHLGTYPRYMANNVLAGPPGVAFSPMGCIVRPPAASATAYSFGAAAVAAFLLVPLTGAAVQISHPVSTFGRVSRISS